MSEEIGNMHVWNMACETDPKYTKAANVSGNKITAIDPYYQIMQATKHFGMYGKTWGFRSIDLDYSLLKYNLVSMKAIFFHPHGEFPIINSCKLYRDKNQTMIDADFAKKIETDTLTKALSKLGFNVDIFLGKFDNNQYVSAMKEKYNENNNPKKKISESYFKDLVLWLKKGGDIEQIKKNCEVNVEMEIRLKTEAGI